VKKELCDIGQHLWIHYRSTFEEDLYENYISHIRSCPECIQKLGLTEEDVEILNVLQNLKKL
jgi:hypothetical protein